ncbi:hypothetical protein INS49_008940 [Diaporthe citri]|uniref:uncharacterized protein n=1 Tax=Diaporthe citri TaxID=83186 RepID=UPI001C821415|nr:uncharacterized protein INS49_008940 [Diaporthe citri]KAG6363837.1 hypothetical protein INS49_008940 [Diaporthe citri]
MNLLHFVLLTLLGSLASSMAMVPPRLMTGVAAHNVEQALNHTAEKEVAGRPGTTIASILVKYELRCGLDPNTPSAPFTPGYGLKDIYCKKWFECKPDEIDKPEKHFAYNMGCVDPYGGLVQGQYGNVARDPDSVEPLNDDDGLMREDMSANGDFSLK